MRIFLLVALLGTTASAAPDPAEISGPRPDELVALNEAPISISPTPYLNAKKYSCALTQGKTTWSSGDQQYPICKVPLADQKKFKPGDATVTVRVFVGNRWLPAATEKIQLTGTEESAPESPVAQVDPATVKPLTGGGKSFKLLDGKIKVTLAIGADKWKVLRPGDVEDHHITFHHGNDERAVAEIFTNRCDADDPKTCPAYAIEFTLKCGDTPERKLVALTDTRAASSCVWTKEMRNKRENRTETVHWEAGGFAEFHPATHTVVSCGAAAASPAHFAEVMRLCATMKVE